MDLLTLYFIITAALNLILGAYSVYLSWKPKFVIKESMNGHPRKLSLVLALMGLMGSVSGYVIRDNPHYSNASVIYVYILIFGIFLALLIEGLILIHESEQKELAEIQRQQRMIKLLENIDRTLNKIERD